MMSMIMRLIGAVALLGCAQLQAAELTIGRSTEPSSIDPLFARTGNNQMTANHMFESLTTTDANLQLLPSLATAWKVVDPLTWEIKLRSGVTFSDGSALTPQDVIYSLQRARMVPNSPAPFSGAVAAVASVEEKDGDSIIIRTRTPSPQLIETLGIVFIMSKTASEGKTTAELNEGKGLIGTGPYRFVSWRRSDQLVLEANTAYWGGKQAFDKVTLKFIPNAQTRSAALLSGQVDLIEEAPVNDLDVMRNKGFGVYGIETGRIVYLALDSARTVSPFITDAQGKPLDPNPLKDARVRRAMSLMIDRNVLVARLLNGSGVPAAQMVPQGLGGYDASIRVEKADAVAAKKLLTEVGYPNGFGITVHTSSDRFPFDRDVGQALGQFFSRGGLKLNGVEAQIYAVYATAASKQEFSAFVFSYGLTTPSVANALQLIIATNDQAKGTGSFNRARYSNAAFDAALEVALAEFDEAKRNAALTKVAHLAHDDMAVIPLYFQKLYWAVRPGLTYAPGKDERTVAMQVGVQK